MIEETKEPLAGVTSEPPFKPKGSSITLLGCGRRDGSDVNNSMGLVEAYRLVVAPTCDSRKDSGVETVKQ